MNRAKRNSIIAMTAAVFAGFAVTAAAQPTEILVLTGQGPDSAAVQMADQQGYYKAAGLNVTIRTFTSGSDALKVFSTGLGDVINLGELSAITNWSHGGGALTVISPLTRTSKGYVVQAQKSIKTPRDLAGKKIGVVKGSTNQYFLNVFLTKNGLKESDVEVLFLPYSALVPALDKGQIDAFVSFQPMGFQSDDLSGDKVHALADGTGYFEGNYLMAARTAWIEKNPKALAAFLDATRKGMQYAIDHPEDVYAYEKKNYNYDRKLFDRQLSVTRYSMTFDDDFTNNLTGIAKWAQQAGVTKADVPMSQFLKK